MILNAAYLVDDARAEDFPRGGDPPSPGSVPGSDCS